MAGQEESKVSQNPPAALRAAQRVALRRGQPEVDAEHLLLALLDAPDRAAPRLLDLLDADPERLRGQVEEDLSLRPTVSDPAPDQVLPTPRLRRVVAAAERAAARLDDGQVSAEHLLLALAEEGPAMPAARRLREHGVTRESILSGLTRVRRAERVTES